MFNDNPDAKWSREFSELGTTRVREVMLGRAWDKEKRQAARRWLEKQDVKVWQATRGAAAVERIPLKVRLRQSRWWIVVVVGMFALMGLARFLR